FTDIAINQENLASGERRRDKPPIQLQQLFRAGEPGVALQDLLAPPPTRRSWTCKTSDFLRTIHVYAFHP
ncbi:MAG TPA: hypothetical protein PLK81_08970, partial [Kiritimatiellia bacterium]|nr:hypothetical protein [Kiritimatiellia bacterium]